MKKIPKDFPVQPLKPGQPAGDRATCGTCGLSWDDSLPTEYTPAPGGRCPFEYFHNRQEPKTRTLKKPRVKVLIEVRGGIVQAVYSDGMAIVDVEVMDHDNIAAGEADETPPEYAELITTGDQVL